MLRIGCGFDVHAFAAGRRLRLGGVDIAHERGLAGHSDADAPAHALADALLGALGLGDIGGMFPDTAAEYKDADSMTLLTQVVKRIHDSGAAVVNADISIALQRPKLAPHIAAMRENLAACLRLPPARVSVKATTTERLGFVGREEGIAVYAVALLETHE